jgi:peptidoglycan/xylan/chitin deacetylase (PgdA/CDA1 family)
MLSYLYAEITARRNPLAASHSDSSPIHSRDKHKGDHVASTAKYKLTGSEFEVHLAAIAKARDIPSSSADELADARGGTLPFLLTFDDGGESAATRTADLLEKHGWRGHFFVTAGQISKRGFLSTDQIRCLRKKGHVIGSHSFFHRVRISHCSEEELTEEWTRSIKILSDILAG